MYICTKQCEEFWVCNLSMHTQKKQHIAWQWWHFLLFLIVDFTSLYVITLVFCHWLKDQKWPKQEQPTDRLLHILFTLPSADCKWLQHVKWRSAKPIKAKNTCMLSTCEYIRYAFVALLLIWEKRPFHDLQMSWRGKVCKAYSKREKQGEKVSHVLLMEESWTKPALCYLLNKITTPLFPPGAFTLLLGCPSLSCSPSLSLSLLSDPWGQ